MKNEEVKITDLQDPGLTDDSGASSFVSEDSILLIPEEKDRDMRLDVFICSNTEGMTRNNVQKAIEQGRVIVEGRTSKANLKIKPGDRIMIIPQDPQELSLEPENIPLDVIYEDSEIIIINKPRGMTVHPAPGSLKGTLVAALLYRCTDLSDINGVIRPGIVHRIDKDTTGLIAVAKTNEAHVKLAEQLMTHSMKREYLAICEGVINEKSATVDAPIGRHPTDRKKMAVNTQNGKRAVTHFTVEERFRNATLVKCSLETGRTHQIRVHMAYIGHPVAGDPLYGMRIKRNIEGQALHAFRLVLTHPKTGELMTFEAEPPEDFKNLLKELREE